MRRGGFATPYLNTRIKRFTGCRRYGSSERRRINVDGSYLYLPTYFFPSALQVRVGAGYWWGRQDLNLLPATVFGTVGY